MGDTAYDNRATVTVGGRDYEVEASNLASVIYSRQFRRPRGAKDAEDGSPYTGSLVQDIVEDYTLYGLHAGEVPDWGDYSHILGAVWAMARAAGSTDQGWPEFEDGVMRSAMDAREPAAAASVIFNNIGPRTFFRGLAGGAGADGAPDHVDRGAAS